MPIKSLKPITPGQRGRTVNGFDAITTDNPEKSLPVSYTHLTLPTNREV